MAPKTTKKSRNPDLICGVGKYSRSTTYHKRGLWAIKAKNGSVFPRHDKKPATAEPPVKPPKFYPADDVKKPLVNKGKPKPTKLRGEPVVICSNFISASTMPLILDSGHGGSDGLHAYVHSLDDAVMDVKSFIGKVLVENPGLPCFCFRHSTGALIILKAALDPALENQIAGIVLTSPAVGVQPSHPIFLG